MRSEESEENGDPMSANIVTLTSDNFDDQIKQAATPILVDFWAEWCGPCRMVTPVLEKLADEYSGKARIGKVNVDEHSGLATKFGVQSIPTLLLFKKGKVVEQFIGATTRDVLAKMIDKHVSG
jgi:thioredoxin 1